MKLGRWLVAVTLVWGCARANQGPPARAVAPTTNGVPAAAKGPAGAAPGAAGVSLDHPVDDDDDTSGVVGHQPPEWETSQWFNSPPLTLAGLRGRVVFVRWFMSPDCPFCAGTAPALRELHVRYGKPPSGLVVVGMYHHKDEAPLSVEAVRGWTRHYGYTFPVAIDADWRTVKRWWLDGHPHRGFTSVSFLIDRRGLVRRVHLGGLIDSSSAEFRAIEADVERLLAEPPPPAAASPAP